MRSLILLLSLGLVGPAGAADLPILSGRWSSAGCQHASAAQTRYFGARSTATAGQLCAITVTATAGTAFHAHLACRYGAAQRAEDEVVLKVNAPTSLDWIDSCSATSYHYCAPGGVPVTPRP